MQTTSGEYLVTGAKGFVGRHILEVFRERRVNCRGIDLPEFDLSQPSVVDNQVRVGETSFIIHAATSRMVGFKYSSNTLKNNLLMVTAFLRHASDKLCFVNLGSGSEYSRDNWGDSMKESLYGEKIPVNSDHEFSKYVISSLVEKNHYSCNIRLFGIFGEYDSPTNKFVSNCLAKSMLGQDIVIHRDRKMSFAYVGDLPRVIISYSDKFSGLGSVNFCGPRPVLLSQIAEIARDLVGNRSVAIRVLNSSPGRSYVGNSDKFNNIFPSFQWTSLATGIQKVHDWLEHSLSDEFIQQVLKDEYLLNAKTKDV